jgi:hypothetical protein
MIEVVVTDEFKHWYEALSMDEQESVFRVVSLLESRGVSLGFPYSSAIESSHHGLRELRVQHQGRPYRVLYAFDPERKAVLLVAGDKSGVSEGRFYRKLIKRADTRFDQHLGELKKSKG